MKTHSTLYIHNESTRVKMRAFVLTLLPLLASAAEWNYDDPDKDWCELSDVCCKKATRQSPIDIDTSIAKKASIDPLLFGMGYFQEASGDLLNNGHALQFNPTDGVTRVLRGGPLGDEEYALLQFHFHWGKDSKSGSEHTLDGKEFAGELHLVHFNTKYTELDDILGNDDGLAVVGMFIEEDKKSDGDFKKFFKAAKKLTKAKDSSKVKINVGDFLAQVKDFSKLTTYPGSLTTPNCQEVVTWLNLLDPIKMGKKDLAALRKFKDANGDKLDQNYRPVQDLMDRTIQIAK